MDKKKEHILKELRPKTYHIYGIFDFTAKNLVYVSMDYEEVELQFELADYDEGFDIIQFNVMVT